MDNQQIYKEHITAASTKKALKQGERSKRLLNKPQLCLVRSYYQWLFFFYFFNPCLLLLTLLCRLM